MPKKNVKSLDLGSQGAWEHMIRLWKHHQMQFAQHYHRRSNVESTFGMMKRKWGDYNRCKLPTTQTNETLALTGAIIALGVIGNSFKPILDILAELEPLRIVAILGYWTIFIGVTIALFKKIVQNF